MKRFALKSSTGWELYLLLGLALLPGRYNWYASTQSPSWRGLLCSAFFFCILVPLVSEALRRAGARPATRKACLIIVTFFLSFPYRWLGLSQWSRQNGPGWFEWKSFGYAPNLVWFPKALWAAPLIPGELLLFPSLALVLLGSGWLYVRARRLRGRSIAAWLQVLGATAILLIVGETWLHISLRSPYTYVPHFERPVSEGYWYHVALFPNGEGLVNADYFVFRALQDLFMGTPESFNGMLIRRPFPFYLSSQFGLLLNPYYVMLCSNVVLWILAVLASGEYFAAHFGRAQGAIGALFVASGPGFIMYVAQPQTYLWGYCAVILVLWAHWKICGTPEAKMRDYIFFGGILSLALLTYDLLALLLYVTGYEILFKKRFKGIFVSCALAVAIYTAFGWLTAPMASFVHDDRNSKFIGISIANIMSLLGSSPIGANSYPLYGALLPDYVWNLSNSVFVFPLLLALFGLFFIRNTSQLKLIGLLVLPSLASNSFLSLGQGHMDTLHLGRIYLAALPRLAFVGYPAVYSLAGVAIWSAVCAARPRWGYTAIAIAVCAIAMHIALVNADVFGYPWLYYLFYYQKAALPGF